MRADQTASRLEYAAVIGGILISLHATRWLKSTE